MTADPLVQLRNATKCYANTAALHSINLSVARGKTTVLIGPSGCGKSTVLRLIIGLVEPDTGEILFGGEPIINEIDNLRQRIGYVIQEGGLFPHLTARANILLMARHLGRAALLKLDGLKPSSSQSCEGKMAIRLAELCELTRFSAELLARYPIELSGG